MSAVLRTRYLLYLDVSCYVYISGYKWMNECLLFNVLLKIISLIRRRCILVAGRISTVSCIWCCITGTTFPETPNKPPHPVTLYWHRTDQSTLYPLNAERLARKQNVPFLKSLVGLRPDPGLYPDLPVRYSDTRATRMKPHVYCVERSNYEQPLT